MSAMSETTASFMGRPILAKHREFAFYRPTALVVANVLADIPIVIITISLFNIVFYFLVNFQHDGGKFFTNWFIIIVATLCFTSFFRMIGAWCRSFGFASQITGWSAMVMLIYGGKFGMVVYKIRYICLLLI